MYTASDAALFLFMAGLIALPGVYYFFTAFSREDTSLERDRTTERNTVDDRRSREG